MKGIIGVILIIGILAIMNIDSSEKVLTTITKEDIINRDMAIVSIAKKTVSEQNNLNNQLSQINLINQTSKVNNIQKQNISSLMDMAEQTNK